ncbi:MAG: FAD-dependent oxidoreductase [Pseudomonadota bacterium]
MTQGRRIPKIAQQRVAVVGSGIAGLSAAWLLSQSCETVLFERASKLGGHSNTVDVDLATGPVPVDTGFIVYNEPSYPNLTALFDHLGVATEDSCMSFGVSIDDGAIEYSGQTLSSVFARRSNAASPTFWKMLSDIPRFHRDAKNVLRDGFCAHASLGEFVQAHNYGRGFCEHFLKPMAAAIWSTPRIEIFKYPALSFFQFFENHGLLRVLNLPEWRTVSAGSRQYVNAIASAMDAEIRTDANIVQIRRTSEGIFVDDATGAAERFDHVVIATHADAARAMLGDMDEEEQQILSAFRYQPNKAVLHFDAGQMPTRRRAWSSWNFIGNGEEGAVTYWMNRLQNLPCENNIFVTLNPTRSIPDDLVIDAFDYEHPMFDTRTAQAQRDIWRIQGRGGVWHAGAHLGHGFHEDGLQAGLAVAEAIGGRKRPWRVAAQSDRLQLPDVAEAMA